ncbi:hypothetical protein MNEG_6924 [Monoraphidium neglectum]|uniref:Uncharacterized protein n=1 Tax=Monoraphidium neglectum TaxID=145388 RepID=A0A0D2L0Y4_9CHLO|nr:hypothetical protein MNEG_6924 [Monoraphidium neglectum]KIZ01039.1 hypothetical protein MNEG_6924 [Monoraphidium neglectum]|eukprot:XP_013900058.1 hypothetical protein MNEG_6924 [Monoraphidium neglectum]
MMLSSSGVRASCARYLSRQAPLRCMAMATPSVPTLNLANCVDKAHEGKALREIIKLTPGALQGLKEGAADDMLGALNVKTIEALGTWKHYRLAKAILVLADTEVAGKRLEGSGANINSGVDKAFENYSFQELLDAPPSALQGLAQWSDTTLAQLRIKTIKDLAQWKFARWAEALTIAAEFENPEGGSR